MAVGEQLVGHLRDCRCGSAHAPAPDWRGSSSSLRPTRCTKRAQRVGACRARRRGARPAIRSTADSRGRRAGTRPASRRPSRSSTARTSRSPAATSCASARNGCTLNAYGRFCSSVKPYFCFSHGQNVVLLAAPMAIGLALEVGQRRRARMRDRSTVGFFWNVAPIVGDRQPLLERRQRLQVVAHGDVELAGGEQLQRIDLRAAHADRHVEAVPLVDALGHRLVEAAVLGLREPVRAEHEARERLRVQRAAATSATSASSRRARRGMARSVEARRSRLCGNRRAPRPRCDA